ncbi:16S rRNA (cytosine(1402)-N(4))-methyltransferase RsmH [Polynucleobacter sp. IMCC 30228]|uniref:16S rRNA (cytosine(1402)-N(4))-methyltransferase RsmH n=1 Tax=Polynucleobacter sp. IMCC 30228 TaxID=2781011 RepID=UPI001F37A9C3|nr:16S rRNA (cytosine(1402)-N(4))-methyltransferase RsmH [Polynucleobacter sp. IMCC 30228]MCE7526170.1 16S rRNA (cytosine(1402)-N(4))-methyltransferase RsmH [Polynucleobacter sp. IMCC 30228]
MNYSHRPVLLAEAVTALTGGKLSSNAVLIDGTFGRGGHSQALLNILSPQAQLLAFDKDLSALAAAQTITDSRFTIVHSSFAAIAQFAKPASVDGVLLDLGISSPQVEEAERGFSFRRDGPLDMRMDTSQGITALQWLEQASSEEITEVIKIYGEERYAPAIARAIVAERTTEKLPQTTVGLAQLIAKVVRSREPGQDPATRTFQALRIFINRELDDLQLGLQAALTVLKPGGRLVVISFHSLEDRIVKQFMRAHATVEMPRKLPVRAKDLPQAVLKLIARVRPSASEITENPRARSAVMRVAEKQGTDA